MIALTIGGTAPARAQQALPSQKIEVHPTFDITALYRTSAGFGIGGGVDVLNAWRPGSQFSLDAYVAQRAGEYEVSFFPRSLNHEGYAGGISAAYETYGRRAFYGLGPASTKNNRVRVENDLASVAAHAGFRRGMHGLISTLRYRTGTLHSFENDIPNAFSRLDSTSSARLYRDVGQRVSGLSLELAGYLDRRRPERGNGGWLIEAGAEGFLDLEPTSYDHLQVHASVMVFVPAGQATFIARGFALHTEPLGDPLPLVLLPRLNHRFAIGPDIGRFAGNDLLLFDVQAVHPVPTLFDQIDEEVLGPGASDLLGKIATDGFLVLSAFNAYDNLFTDARLAPSWAKKFAPARRYPLRAAVGAGIRVYDPSRRSATLTGALSLSADGFLASSISFTLDPHRLRAPWRW